MASFKAKTRRDQLRMRGKKNYRSDPFKPFSEQGIPKKQQKIKKNINMASSQAKTGRQRLRMRQKENSRFEPFQPDLEEGIPEKQQKNEKTSLWIPFKPKQEGQAKNEREKIFSFRSIPTRLGIGNSKNIAKKLKTSIWLLLKLKRDGTS